MYPMGSSFYHTENEREWVQPFLPCSPPPPSSSRLLSFHPLIPDPLIVQPLPDCSHEDCPAGLRGHYLVDAG